MRKTLTAAALIGILWSAQPANASVFKFWAAVRGDYFDSTGDIMAQEGISNFRGGLEFGFEVIGITTYAEAMLMASDQYLFTLNAGLDFSFGDTVRFSIGAFTGPLLFLFPNSDAASGADLSRLSPADQSALLNAGGFASLDEAEASFNVYAEQEEDLSRTAFGWNLIRARLTLDVGLAGPLYLGIAGQFGYHLLITGEEAAAGAKNEAVDEFASEYALPSSLTNEVRRAVGAEPVDQDNLNGFNWDANLYLRFEFGG
ncbi:MAG: hypothetical protein KC561_10340 [Myxococcales bacterium]|nr:hypothetical protein [Myxococcales bacterium]